MNALSEQLRKLEWYDNSTISKILGCLRQTYFAKEYRGGLTAGVGDGANFGTVQHAARAVYFDGKKHGLSEPERRAAAMRRLMSEHQRIFGEAAPGVARKHSMANAIDLFDYYCDNWMLEDNLWVPIETELAGVVIITPQAGDPPMFETPFHYVFRCDGLWLRTANNDLFVSEFKTTSGGVDREVTRRAIDRQTTGYVYSVKQFPDGAEVQGVFLDVMGVTVEKRDFRREVYMKNDNDLASWRRQTINIVEHWRSLKRRVENGEPALETFVQNDSSCTNYGLCPFWKGCYHGIQLLDELPVNEWTPFEI